MPPVASNQAWDWGHGDKTVTVLSLQGKTDKSTHITHIYSKCGRCHQGKAAGIVTGKLTGEPNWSGSRKAFK